MKRLFCVAALLVVALTATDAYAIGRSRVNVRVNGNGAVRVRAVGGNVAPANVQVLSRGFVAPANVQVFSHGFVAPAGVQVFSGHGCVAPANILVLP